MKNAYFGKPYKTRDGRKAIYIKDFQYDNGLVCVVYEDIASIHRVMKNGHYWANSNVETDDDIISEWQEPVDEETLDKAFNDYIVDARAKCGNDKDVCKVMSVDNVWLKQGFNYAYHKAIEQYETKRTYDR